MVLLRSSGANSIDLTKASMCLPDPFSKQKRRRTAHNAIRDVLSKPDQYIAVDVTCSQNLQFGGTKAPAAMVSQHLLDARARMIWLRPHRPAPSFLYRTDLSALDRLRRQRQGQQGGAAAADRRRHEHRRQGTDCSLAKTEYMLPAHTTDLTRTFTHDHTHMTTHKRCRRTGCSCPLKM